MSSGLCLTVTDYTDAQNWRWRLESDGRFLADHTVKLDPTEAEYSGFVDLQSYLKQYAAPDKWPEDESRLIEQVGEWMGENVLGPVGAAIMEQGTPATVRVSVPSEAAALLYRPLELAHVEGRPLALQDVSFVYEIEGEGPVAHKTPVGDRLRMLAIFSLPTGVSALALRRERYELQRLIGIIAQTHGKALDLRVLQYGVTRKNLAEVLEEGEGWDVIHFSGHGLHKQLVLEKPDGTEDPIPAEEFADLVRVARSRLKLVTLSSCLSAATTIEETLLWLGITPRAPAARRDEGNGEPQEVSSLAGALVTNLGCAVMAMRFPVADDFAIGFCSQIYERLFGRGQALDRALQLSLPAALEGGPHPGVPPISVATPALFGRAAADLELPAPAPPPATFEIPPTGLAYFPDEPERFVGRVGQMVRASAALAPQSGKTGVLFHGMAGAGKTACALELVYRYRRERFQGLVWHKAPDEGVDIAGALVAFAVSMERQLPGFTMVHVADRPAKEFDGWLPVLTQFLEENNVLIVLDNLESLLSSAAAWRDPRWGHLVAALLAHSGLSRVVLTSRRRPADSDHADQVQVEPIHALSLNEATLLARQLPHLGRLLRGTDAVGPEQGRELVSRTLAVVQGHPKLIELAEGQAADPEVLAHHLERAEAAWTGQSADLQAFFRDGDSRVDAEAFFDALIIWTQAIAGGLPQGASTLLQFLCALEEPDRQRPVVEPVWPNLWRRLELPGDTSDLSAAFDELLGTALADVRREEDTEAYVIHPGVAAAARAGAGESFQEAVDRELAAFWAAEFQQAKESEGQGAGGLVVHAGRSGAPYMMRLGQWDAASRVLEGAMLRDDSPGMIAAILPLLRHIAESTEGTDRGLIDAALVTKALRHAGRIDEAEAVIRGLIENAESLDEHRVASVLIGDMINILRATGRAGEALPMVDRKKELARLAGLGPWTQLADEGYRLQLLNVLGRYDEVLNELKELRPRMDALPAKGGSEEAIEPWNVRETTIACALAAAIGLERWEECLSLTAEIAASKQARGAPRLEVAYTRYNDYGPLLRLKRYDDARVLLNNCRAVFESEGDLSSLGMVFSALADLEDKLTRHDQAVRFEETAIRYLYLANDPVGCSISHNNVANYLMRSGGAPEKAMAHRLADAIICFQTGSGGLTVTIGNMVTHLARFGPDPPPLPASFDELCDRVEATEGVRFRELFARLPSRVEDGDEALAAVLELASKAMEARDQS